MRPIVPAGLGFAVVLSVVLAVAACTSAATPPAPTAAPPTAAVPSAAAPTAAANVCAEVTDGSPATVEASAEGFTFIPATIRAKVGDIITWTNADAVGHGVALDDGSCRTRSAGRGQTFSLTFMEAGEYRFHCTVHGNSMAGTLEITE